MQKKLFFTLVLLFSFFLSKAYSQEILSWGQCVKEAAKNHPDLIAAEETVKQSEASKRITQSGLFPQVNATLDASRAKTRGVSSSTTADSFSYGVSGDQLLFNGLKTVNEVNAAKEDINASKQAYRFTSTQVRLRLRTAFIDLLKSQEMIKVAEDIIKIRRGNLELITLRYQSGLEHKGALLTAEANLSEANFQLSQAKRDLGLAQRQMTKEMGRKEFVPMLVEGDFKVSDAAREKPDIESLAGKNPSLAQLSAQKNSAAFSLQSAYGDFFPAISASAGANKAGSHWPPRGDEWDLGLTLSLPIFEGGLRQAQVSKAQAVLSQLKENERSSRDQIIVNLDQTWVSLQDAIENVEVQFQQLRARQERSNIAEVEYSTGFINYDNWSIIEDNLVSAKTKYLNAQADALLAEANWIQAKGEVLEYE